MLISFSILIISVCFRILAERIALKWEFLLPMAVISKYILIACAVLFVIMSVITIVKAIKK